MPFVDCRSGCEHSKAHVKKTCKDGVLTWRGCGHDVGPVAIREMMPLANRSIEECRARDGMYSQAAEYARSVAKVLDTLSPMMTAENACEHGHHDASITQTSSMREEGEGALKTGVTTRAGKKEPAYFSKHRLG